MCEAPQGWVITISSRRLDRGGARIVGCRAVRGPRLLTASLTGLVAAGCVGAFFDVSSSAAAGPPRVIPSCAGLVRSPVVYRAGRIAVYRRAVRGDGGPHDWACSSPARSPSASALGLGGAPGGGFVSGAVVGDFVSDGPWLVDLVSSTRGWSSCLSGTTTGPCRRDHHEVELTDVAGSGSQASTTSAAHVELHLSALPIHNGNRIAAVVWTQRAGGSLITLKAVTLRDGRTSATFGANPPVTGRINPGSVHLHGLKVSFVENGRHRTVKLSV